MDKIIEDILEEIKKEVKILKKEEEAALKEWGKALVKIKIAQEKNSSEEEKKRLLKTEAYLWRGIESLKARLIGKIEDRVWDFVERLLNLLKKVMLSTI